jgi:hypothetical protein
LNEQELSPLIWSRKNKGEFIAESFNQSYCTYYYLWTGGIKRFKNDRQGLYIEKSTIKYHSIINWHVYAVHKLGPQKKRQRLRRDRYPSWKKGIPDLKKRGNQVSKPGINQLRRQIEGEINTEGGINQGLRAFDQYQDAAQSI